MPRDNHNPKAVIILFLGLIGLLLVVSQGQNAGAITEKPPKEAAAPAPAPAPQHEFPDLLDWLKKEPVAPAPAPVPQPKPEPILPEKPGARPEPGETKASPVATKGTPHRAGETWTDPVMGMEFVWVPEGTFQMGGGAWAGETYKDENPVHTVQLDGFWMSKYEVTQGQWQRVMGNNPSYLKKGDNYPVEQVSWNDVQDFIRKLNSQIGGQYKFKLPTEAEWEYAARSGGKNELYAGGSDLDAVAWYRENSGSTTHPVGQKAPNGLGLYDMSGNVWELCEDIYSEKAYSNDWQAYLGIPRGGYLRVNRGGSWDDGPRRVRCAGRGSSPPYYRGSDVGFRLVLDQGQNVGTMTVKPPTEAVAPAPAPAPQPKPEPIPQEKSGARPEPEETKSSPVATKKTPHRAGETWTDPVTGMKFVWVPGGTFQMGGGAWAGSTDEAEKPVHTVQLDGFWMGKYEVTQGQWQRVMGNNPSDFKKGDNYPVEQVSWNDVQDFIRKLNSQSGGQYKFKLPTEAEWEYAARSRGKDELYAGGKKLDAVAWYLYNSGNTTHPVGQKAPNGLGLYDMNGNVWEWCQDIYSNKAYSNHSRSNPLNTSGGSYRVYRGGGWFSEPEDVGCTFRGGDFPSGQYRFLGFRLSRMP